MELDEKAISKSIGSSRDAFLHFNVKNDEYKGEPLLFLNDAEKSGNRPHLTLILKGGEADTTIPLIIKRI